MYLSWSVEVFSERNSYNISFCHLTRSSGHLIRTSGQELRTSGHLIRSKIWYISTGFVGMTGHDRILWPDTSGHLMRTRSRYQVKNSGHGHYIMSRIPVTVKWPGVPDTVLWKIPWRIIHKDSSFEGLWLLWFTAHSKLSGAIETQEQQAECGVPFIPKAAQQKSHL